jgi:hypothetical protein
MRRAVLVLTGLESLAMLAIVAIVLAGGRYGNP